MFFLVIPRPPISTLFPYTTLFRSFLQTAASACGAFGLALLGADVASGVSAYCCEIGRAHGCTPVTDQTRMRTCAYDGNGCTYSCTECFQAGGCCCDGCSGVICSQVRQVSCPQSCVNPSSCASTGDCCPDYLCDCGHGCSTSCYPTGSGCDYDY